MINGSNLVHQDMTFEITQTPPRSLYYNVTLKITLTLTKQTKRGREDGSRN